MNINSGRLRWLMALKHTPGVPPVGDANVYQTSRQSIQWLLRYFSLDQSRPATNNYFHYWLFSRLIIVFILFVYEMINSPKYKDIQFTIMYDTEKSQIFIFVNLQPANINNYNNYSIVAINFLSNNYCFTNCCSFRPKWWTNQLTDRPSLRSLELHRNYDKKAASNMFQDYDPSF